MTDTSNEQRHQQSSARRDQHDRHLDRLRAVLGVIAVGLLAMLTWSVFSSGHEAEQAKGQTATLSQQVMAACRAGGAAERELRSIGACGTAEEAARGVASDQPPPVVQVATDEQVRSAVARYLDENPPADGRTPSQAEVSLTVDQAVARYCAANACRGASGDSGTDGADGADGADAPPVPDEQVATRVAAYCEANNGCQPNPEEILAAVQVYCSQEPSPCAGPPGASGAEGPPGPVLPEYYVTRPGVLGPVTLHCTHRAPEDAAAPPHYDCKEVPE